MKVKYATICEKGKRYNNEDSFGIVVNAEKSCWMGIVADGLGGHSCGETASEIVVSVFKKFWQENLNIEDSEVKIKTACKEVSETLDKKADVLNHVEMGSTMAMVSIEGDMATIAHIGDSRCYLIRKGFYDYEDINNTEKDHVVYKTIDHHHPGGEILSRCFFSYRPEVAIADVAQFKVEPNDRILICSDGLYNSILPNILKDRMMDDKTPEQILDTFAFLCEKFGNDNYTGIMAIIE